MTSVDLTEPFCERHGFVEHSHRCNDFDDMPYQTKVHPRLREIYDNGFKDGQGRVKTFPIIYDKSYGKGTIAWDVAVEAFHEFQKQGHGRSTTLENLAERGGFYVSELDKFLPDWKERNSEHYTMKIRIDNLELALYRMLLGGTHGGDCINDTACGICERVFAQRRQQAMDCLAVNAVMRKILEDELEYVPTWI